MRTLKRAIPGFVFVIVVSALSFILWANDAAQPTEAALQSLNSDVQVTVTQRADSIIFEPAARQASTGFVFYPGGRVDVRAYAPALRRIAAQGYWVVALNVKLNLALFDVEAADRVIAEYPQIEYWAVGGHSFGGVAAFSFAAKHPGRVNGLILWASYPANDLLKQSSLRVLSIYGTLDMTGADTFAEKNALLPPGAQIVVIEGGNHAQFGDYGPQPGDPAATISHADQQEQVVQAVVQFLASLSQ
ncbi:MAG: hypothetical protein HFACDABA_02451 [Anaerolineales bacterium]|nr:hypothetical protein [Anaerolineales bacterium]